MTRRSVVVAHRDTMVAEGLAAALSRYPEIVLLGVATSTGELAGSAGRADAVAIDEGFPGAAEAVGRLRRGGVRVVLLGDGSDGSDGEVGVRVSLRGPISTLASALVPGIVAPRPDPRLSRREHEILSLVARGLAAKEVARHLGISEKTVERHKTRMFAKLRAPNQAAAVYLAMAGGIRER